MGAAEGVRHAGVILSTDNLYRNSYKYVKKLRENTE